MLQSAIKMKTPFVALYLCIVKPRMRAHTYIYYCCPVNTDNSLFDGPLYSYKPHYRNPTEKTRISMCKRTRISRTKGRASNFTKFTNPYGMNISYSEANNTNAIRMVLTCATFGSCNCLRDLWFVCDKQRIPASFDLSDLWFVLFVKLTCATFGSCSLK